MDYQIIDNYLDEDVFSHIHESIFTSSLFPWYFGDNASDDQVDESGYFFHLFCNAGLQTSECLNLLWPLLGKLNYKTLIRVKGNLYPRTDILVHHIKHVDYTFPHRGAILYLNTNDGFTFLEDGTRVESIQNRLLLFDPTKSHNSTNCTNAQFRANININFF